MPENNLSSTPPAPPPSTLIMIVDDEWMNREMMEAALQSAGYWVICASSKDTALQLAMERHPDLALVDVRLRTWDDGYELCRALKANPATAPTRVVMITALDSDEARQKAFEAGANDFIARSMDIPRFLNYIERFLKDN